MKKMVEFSKFDKAIISILFIYAIVMLVVFLPKYLANKYNDLYIVTNNVSIKFADHEWQLFKEQDYKDRKFDVYSNGEYLGKYSILHQDKIYVYDYDEYKNVEYNGTLFANSGHLKITAYHTKINKQSNDDTDALKLITSELKIPEIDNSVLFEKKLVDIDNDQIDEAIYSINNFASDSGSVKFSVIAIYNDGKIMIVDSTVTDNEGIYTKPILSIDSLFYIEKYKKYYLIYTNNYFSQPEATCTELYDLSNNKLIHNFCE